MAIEAPFNISSIDCDLTVINIRYDKASVPKVIKEVTTFLKFKNSNNHRTSTLKGYNIRISANKPMNTSIIYSIPTDKNEIHMNHLADILTEGIVKPFPEKF